MYEIILSNVAKKDLDKISSSLTKRITSKLLTLENNPRPVGCLKLKGKDGYRIRIGDYRILYEIIDSSKEVIIYRIAHRREVYR